MKSQSSFAVQLLHASLSLCTRCPAARLGGAATHPKHSRRRPSHSLKLTSGGGFLGSMRTTELSTFGGGRKLFLPTFMR